MKHEKSLVMTHGTLLTLHDTPNFSLQPSDGLRSVAYRLSSGTMRQASLRLGRWNTPIRVTLCLRVPFGESVWRCRS